MSAMIQRVIAIAAMMVTTVERVKTVVWTALMALWLRAMKTDHHNGTGRSHVTGQVQGTHGGSGMSTRGMSTRGRRSRKEVKSDYKWEEVGAGEWI